MAIKIFGLTVDVSGVESDGSRWTGKATISGLSSVSGTWIGFEGSDMGELCDVEGSSEALCRFVEENLDDFESAITDLLGDPCEDDGRTSMWETIEQERAVHEARLGMVA